MKTNVRFHYRKKRIPVRQHTRIIDPAKRRKGIISKIKRGSKKRISGIENVGDKNVLYTLYSYASTVPEGVRIDYLGLTRPGQKIAIRQTKGKKEYTFYTYRIFVRKTYPSGMVIETPIKIKNYSGWLS